MDVDGNGFIVNGQRTFIASGSIHYPRVPVELWHDRLLRLRRAGFNTVQTYAFWNYHEPRENEWNFTGDHDFEQYLKEAQSLDLYATVRVGPYVCAEWDSGGYPIWAKFKPDVVVRQGNPGYLALQDHWLGEILPKVAAHQINKGGNVILVQLENEGKFSGAWTDKAPDAYYQDIHDQAEKNGIEVPYFMSGLHHGSYPVVDTPDNTGRLCPWYSTEIWAGWYLNYGMEEYGYMRIVNCVQKIIARGGNGYNLYMFHGGTNFDSWNDNENAASYDYGGTVGEAGDLRPAYYALKATNFFSTSFSDILENSSNAIDDYRDFATHAHVIGARKGPAGTVIFVEGEAADDNPAVIKSAGAGTGGSLHILPLEIVPIVLDAPIVPAPGNIKIVQATTAIFGLAHNGSTTTLIVFGQPGDTGVLTLDLAGEIKKIEVAYPTAMPAEVEEKSGGQTLRILSMSRQLADRTWIVGHPKHEYIVVGPEFVGDFSINNGQPSLTIERPYGHPAPNKVVVYGPSDQPAQHLEVKADLSLDAVPVPALGPWRMASPAESNPTFDDSSWKTSDDPQEMGADGDISAFAWYRATAQAPQAGAATIHFPGAADHLIVFVNGALCPVMPSVVDPKPVSPEMKNGGISWTATAQLNAGANSIAVLATHQGRDKAGGYWGPIDHYFPKGLFKPVSIDLAGQQIDVKGWKMHGGLPDPAKLAYQPLAATNGPAFFSTTFTAVKPGIGADPVFRLPTDDLSRGTVFLNGHCLGRYPATIMVKKKQLALYLPECWLAADGRNQLVIFDEEGKSPAQIGLIEEKETSREVIAVSKPADPATPIELPPFTPNNMREVVKLSLSLEKPVTVSSSDSDNVAENINDGDGMSFWTPATPPSPDHPAWFSIDLQKPYNLARCWMAFGAPMSLYPYLIEGSPDGANWTPLADTRQADPAADVKKGASMFIPLTNADNIRYIRVTVAQIAKDAKPFRVYDFRVEEAAAK